jgi:hypothetical protein|tara:strand:- start:4172 stop:4459 length:288 start_codon:yes stop_codon:yes gene_type:complete
MAIVFKSRFRKWFVKELIKAFDGENDVVVITFDEKYNEKGDPVQKFYSADNIDLEVMHKTATIQVKPFEELWVRKNRERVEHIFLKDPIENKTGN